MSYPRSEDHNIAVTMRKAVTNEDMVAFFNSYNGKERQITATDKKGHETQYRVIAEYRSPLGLHEIEKAVCISLESITDKSRKFSDVFYFRIKEGQVKDLAIDLTNPADLTRQKLGTSLVKLLSERMFPGMITIKFNVDKATPGRAFLRIAVAGSDGLGGGGGGRGGGRGRGAPAAGDGGVGMDVNGSSNMDEATGRGTLRPVALAGGGAGGGGRGAGGGAGGGEGGLV